MNGLACRECGAVHPAGPTHVCDECFGPLEPRYPSLTITREAIAARPPSMWRYAELLPVAPVVGFHTGMTPLVRADRLAARLGLPEVWIKNEAVSHPTLSFKDRLVAVAISAARALGLGVVACSSTGNLACAAAAMAAAAGMPCVVVVPQDVEPAKLIATSVHGAQVVAVRGTYDDANRLCSELADRQRGWGFLNINLKPYYAEGSKTVGYEIAEQLGWRLPAHVVVPMAGGSLLTKIDQAFTELRALGLCQGERPRLHGTQAAGCAPIVQLVESGGDTLMPVATPRTIARSLAVGDPGDGYYARDAIVGSRGHAAAVDDAEILAAMRLLAETEGLFVEPGAATAVAGAAALARQGRLGGDGPVVLCITGHGARTSEVLLGKQPPPLTVDANVKSILEAFERSLAGLITSPG